MTTETTFYRVRRTGYDGFTEWLTHGPSGPVWTLCPGDTYRSRLAAELELGKYPGARVVTVRHKLIPAKVRTHDRAWALRQLAKGRAVTRPGWTEHARIEVTELGPQLFAKHYNSKNTIRLDIGRSLAEPDGYTLWKEPAK